MKVVVGRPPMFAEIAAAFPLAHMPGVIFAWGSTIFNPVGGPLPPAILAHEAVHGARQGADVEGWWRKYIADPRFRLDEEVPAHAAELRERLRGVAGLARLDVLSDVAGRLASPLYGSMLSLGAAKSLLAETL